MSKRRAVTPDPTTGRSKSASGSLIPPRGGAVIRMYRQGLGDCFLLAFATEAQTGPAYVLVDCGVHSAQPDNRKNQRKIVDDIVQATGGHVHIVVATHEHSDHLSAFKHEADVLLRRKLTVDRLWLGWTENDQDDMARQLRRHRVASQQAVKDALERLKNKHSGDRAATALAGQLDAALSFFRDDMVDDPQQNTALAMQLALRDPNKVTGNELALAVLREQAEATDYLVPGKGPIPIPGATAARAYVLGPPRDVSALKTSDPSGGARRETYLTSATGLFSLSAALLRNAAEDPAEEDLRAWCFPFDRRYRTEYEGLGSDHPSYDFFHHQYGMHDPDHAQRWRQIENDWLYAAGELALQLDKHTNNTSVVLAFELGEPGQGPVLLFPGDAQVGSWLSWKELRWSVGCRSVSVQDLFRRTAVYKVGHHASHNATLKRDGLELMPEGLIALIPVDQKAAGKLRGWHMPYGKLYTALKAKTGGNMLRADDGLDTDLPIPRTRFGPVPGVERTEWRRSRVQKEGRSGALYYDLKLDPEESR